VRVLNILHDRRFGGPQSRVIQVAPLLRLENWESVVAMPEGEDGTFSAMLSLDAIPHIEFDLVRLRRSTSLLEHWNYIKGFWPNVRRLRRIIREEGIGVVHVNGIMHLQGPVAARLEKVGLVWHLNEIASPRLLQVLCRPLVRRWSSVIAVSSEAVREHYFPSRHASSSPQQGLRVLYPPVDPGRFTVEADGERVRNEFGIPRSAPVIGMVAHLNPFKGIEFLIGAMPAIKTAFPSAKLLIVGRELETQKEYVASLRRMTQVSGCCEDILFLGPRADIPDVLAAMSVYVQASLSESFGMATAEASAAGLPVVATNVGGTGEVVASGVSGVLVEPGSARAIADGVIAVLKDPAMGRRMGAAGRRRIKTLFSLESCTAMHLSAYQDALSAECCGHGRGRERRTSVVLRRQPKCGASS